MGGDLDRTQLLPDGFGGGQTPRQRRTHEARDRHTGLCEAATDLGRSREADLIEVHPGRPAGENPRRICGGSTMAHEQNGGHLPKLPARHSHRAVET